MKRSKRYTQREMFAHYEAWKQSGQRQRPYCVQHGLAYSTFHRWANKYRKEAQPKSEFIPINVQPDPELSEKVSAGELLFLFPNGVQLLCRDNTSSELLKNLINP